MDVIFGPEVREFTLNYIDDVLIVLQTFEAHLVHLKRVLQRLQEEIAGITSFDSSTSTVDLPHLPLHHRKSRVGKATLAYSAGFVANSLLKKYGNCNMCGEVLLTSDGTAVPVEVIEARTYVHRISQKACHQKRCNLYINVNTARALVHLGYASAAFLRSIVNEKTVDGMDNEFDGDRVEAEFENIIPVNDSVVPQNILEFENEDSNLPSPSAEPSTSQWKPNYTPAQLQTPINKALVDILCPREESDVLIHPGSQRKGLVKFGTIRSNRLRGCVLEADKDLLKRGRGIYDYKVDNKAGIAVTKCADTKCVTLASFCVAHTPIFEVKRYSKDERKKINVESPQIIKQYNTHMGGVDLADMLVALYKVPFKSRRWYLGIFGQMIDIAVNNAWLQYRRDHESLGLPNHDRLKQFRLNLASALISNKKLTKIRKSDFAKQPKKKIKRTIKESYASMSGRCHVHHVFQEHMG
ncbi:hypothetical protein GEV33_002317 [Tenebrio molitor]|uniref:PiggyBac transposable element-derived protein domain-containing protein n=1 Tax=Tenebrio molitor TaxID=7067 RepID=A0A8J6HTR4_TENMO|nr:hypothetical protein GEV33_002317 [Tenebrio molitor]